MTFWATEDEQIQVAVGRFSMVFWVLKPRPCKTKRHIWSPFNHGEMLDWRYFSAFVRSVEYQKLFCGRFLGEANLGVL